MLNILIANLPYLLKGAVVTLWLSLIVVTLGTLSWVRSSAYGPASVGGSCRHWSRPTSSCCAAFRSLVVMLLGYYAFPALGLRANAYLAVGVAQIVYIGAFVAEIVRSAVLSVPAGQIAAAKSLGMRRIGILRHVVLPQAARIAIPPLLNNSLTAIKQTSYVSVVGAWELTYAAREVVERTLAAFQIFPRRHGDLLSDLLSPVPARALVRKRFFVAH